MNNNTKRWSGWVLSGLSGLFLLYLAGRFLVTGYQLQKLEKVFNQVEHPSGTFPVDNIRLRYSYYPATYADDTIHFKFANLAGELRSYDRDWQEIKDLYGGQILENGNPIALIPIEVRKNDEHMWLDVPKWFLISPGHHGILDGIREEYDTWGWSESLNGRTPGLYLVYILGQ